MSSADSNWMEPLGGLALLLGHVMGIAGTSLVLMGWTVGGSPMVVLRALTHGEIYSEQVPHALIHLLFGAVFWVTLVIIARGCWRRFRGTHREGRVIQLSRGSVMTETLIVLPFALMLYIGLAQLAINNVAATLANLATFQAARSMWVWMPEARGGRRFVTTGLAVDKARVQAAMALTPVAAGDYGMNFAGLSDSARAARAGLVAGQLPLITTDQGALITDAALLALSAEDPGGLIRLHTRNNQVMADGLDRSSFRLRTARKFTFAYLSTYVIPIRIGGRVGVQLVYLHFNSMPIVGKIFGMFTMVGGRPGHYSAYKRFFTLPEQYDANPRLP